MQDKNLTGFEAWIRMGLELGAQELLMAEAEALAEAGDSGEYDGDFDLADRARLTARKLQDRWPPWKRAAAAQSELPMDGNVCACCEGTYPAGARMFDTPHGLICPHCMHLYIDQKWPENRS